MHNVVIARLQGGLGNQLFEYAAARRLALATGASLKLDLANYRDGLEQRESRFAQFPRQLRLDSFRATIHEASPDEVRALRGSVGQPSALGRLRRRANRALRNALGAPTHYPEHRFGFDPRVLTLRPPIYLEGYWQSYQYFADQAGTIRQDLAFADPTLADYARDYVAHLRSGGCQVVAVHVRRGDLAYAAEVVGDVNLVHGPPTQVAFVKQAMQQFAPPVRFLVFSDSQADLQWCRQHIAGEHVAYAEDHSDVQDFAIMRACDHNVIANSSFSWWAAWLNDTPGRRVIAPTHWSSPDAKTVYRTDDLIPLGWQQL
jgi:hypothetical protein